MSPHRSLYRVTDTRAGDPLPEVDACLVLGIWPIQVHGKTPAYRTFCDLARCVVKRTAPFGALVVVNDRIDRPAHGHNKGCALAWPQLQVWRTAWRSSREWAWRR